MAILSKTVNDYWQRMRSTLGLGKFLSYSSYETYILVIFTFALTVEREYGAKAAKLTMEWFNIDDYESIEEYEDIIKQDPYLMVGDRIATLKIIMRVKVKSIDSDNYEDYLSSAQWFAAMIFVNKKYISMELGDVDDSALFPSNITRERTNSYLGNPTKLPIFQKSVKFVDGIPFIGSKAMKLHLIAITTSLMWYSNEDIWAKEHYNMWVRGDQSKIWLERRARLNLEYKQPFNRGGIF